MPLVTYGCGVGGLVRGRTATSPSEPQPLTWRPPNDGSQLAACSTRSHICSQPRSCSWSRGDAAWRDIGQRRFSAPMRLDGCVCHTLPLTLSVTAASMRRCLEEVLAPILATEFPTVGYSAALIGSGSDVLGYRTLESADHAWSPRVLLCLYEDADAWYVERSRLLSRRASEAHRPHLRAHR